MLTKDSLAYWQSLAKHITIEGRAFIDGEYRSAQSGETFDCISPIDGQVLGQIASTDKADVDDCVAIARDRFNTGVWADKAPAERKIIMLKFADLIEENQETLALLETLDMGKPISDALTIDVNATLRALRWTAEAIDKVYDEIAATPSDQLGMITRNPVGVVAAIVPWNFPMIMATWKYAPALAMGNSVILKPSEKSPLTAIKLASLAHQAGIPSGVFNVLPGFGHRVGEALARHMDIDTLVFTGSTAIAKRLLVMAGESNMKRVWSEAGGKSANVVFADAPDLAAAAKSAAAAICFNQGEVCTAGSRLLVDERIAEPFIRELRQAFQAWQPGHPLDPRTQLGATVDDTQMKQVLDYIQKGKAQGAQLSLGGEQVTPVNNGYYVQPALFENVQNDMAIAQEEIFGPVLSVITFKDETEALRIANDSIYGLAAAVWTSDLSRAHRFARKLQAGSVWVNQYDGGDMTAPFGGFKQSGNGRDKSLHAFDKYTELKSTWIKF